MTLEQIMHIHTLRDSGLSYRKISQATDIPLSTIKLHFIRNRNNRSEKISGQGAYSNSEETIIVPCKQCGKPVIQNPKRRAKIFCCDKCRFTWWNRNKYHIPRPSTRTVQCMGCGTHFHAYAANRKYCSHECYIKSRFYAKDQ